MTLFATNKPPRVELYKAKHSTLGATPNLKLPTSFHTRFPYLGDSTVWQSVGFCQELWGVAVGAVATKAIILTTHKSRLVSKLSKLIHHLKAELFLWGKHWEH